MLVELFPAIDLSDGQVVRLTQGDYGNAKVYGSDPIAVGTFVRRCRGDVDPRRRSRRSTVGLAAESPGRCRHLHSVDRSCSCADRWRRSLGRRRSAVGRRRCGTSRDGLRGHPAPGARRSCDAGDRRCRRSRSPRRRGRSSRMDRGRRRVARRGVGLVPVGERVRDHRHRPRRHARRARRRRPRRGRGDLDVRRSSPAGVCRRWPTSPRSLRSPASPGSSPARRSTKAGSRLPRP